LVIVIGVSGMCHIFIYVRRGGVRPYAVTRQDSCSNEEVFVFSLF